MEHNRPTLQNEADSTDYSIQSKNQFDFSKVNKDDYLTKPNKEQLHRYEMSEHALLDISRILSPVKKHHDKQETISAKERKLAESRQIIHDFLRNKCPIKSCSYRNEFPCKSIHEYCIYKYINFYKAMLFKFDDNLFFKSMQNNWNFDLVCDANTPYDSEKFGDLHVLKSIYYLIKIDNIYPLSKGEICYGEIIDAIHQNITQYIISKSDNFIFSQANKNTKLFFESKQCIAKNFINTYFPMSEQGYILSINTISGLYKNAARNSRFGSNRDKKYERLYSYLDTICASNKSLLDAFAVLLAKIYCGRAFVSCIDKSKHHCTLIITRNTEFIKNFFNDIIAIVPTNSLNKEQYDLENKIHFTKYTCRELANEENLSELIYYKLIGNIANIDDSTFDYDATVLKKIISGDLLTQNDDVVENLYYRSNCHYVFIRPSLDDSFVKDLLPISDVIDLSESDLDRPYDTQLAFYERFFMVTTFVEYGIELMNTGEREVKVYDPEFYLKEFTGRYVTSSDNDEDFIYQKSSKDEQGPGLYDFFTTFLDAYGYNSTIKINNFKKFITTKYNAECKRAPGHDTRSAFFNIIFDEEKFNSDMKELNNPSNNPHKDTSSDFMNCLTNLIQQHHDKLLQNGS